MSVSANERWASAPATPHRRSASGGDVHPHVLGIRSVERAVLVGQPRAGPLARRRVGHPCRATPPNCSSCKSRWTKSSFPATAPPTRDPHDPTGVDATPRTHRPPLSAGRPHVLSRGGDSRGNAPPGQIAEATASVSLSPKFRKPGKSTDHPSGALARDDKHASATSPASGLDHARLSSKGARRQRAGGSRSPRRGRRAAIDGQEVRGHPRVETGFRSHK
jgi:hypothetical protein